MSLKKLALTGVAFAISSTSAWACSIDTDVNILGNEFPAIQMLGTEAQTCAGADVKTNLTADHKDLQVAALTANPSEYTAAVISNGSITPLLNDGLIRPLDDLVAKHGQALTKNQLITIDGKVMAVAFMANAQHLVYRADILDQIGADVPTSYEEVLAAAKQIRAQGILQNPIGGAYKAGWNIGQEFNNMFLGHGGTFFKAGSAMPNINSQQGVDALNMMKALAEYMNPDYLTHDSNATNAEYRAGNVALMNMWGSRAATLVTVDGVPQAVQDGFAIAGPLTVGGGSDPATTLWWDGWTIAANISDAQAEATFKALVHGIRPAALGKSDNNTLAVWLIDGYQPTEASKGVVATAKAGAGANPMLPYFGLLHSAVGAEISDFMQGKESAEQALVDMEAAYIASAKEKGFL